MTATAPAAVAPVAATPVTAADADGDKLSPAEIDARRAVQLLDRALALSDKGDKAGAIVACRQAISLAPQSAAGYAMLGPLLERSGDTAGAMVAYERVLALVPASPIERDSLARLRATSVQTAKSRGGNLFHFDEGELFQTSNTPNPDSSPAPAPPVAVSGASVAASAAPAPSAAAAATPPQARPAATPSTPVAAPPVATAPVVAPPQRVAPAAPAPSAAPRAPAPMTVPPISAPTIAGVAPSLSFNDPARPIVPRWVRALRGERSFWMQSAPLAVTAVAGLGLLLWARGVAESRVVPSPVISAPEDGGAMQAPSQPQPDNGSPAAPQANNPTPPDFSVSNARPDVAAPAAPIRSDSATSNPTPTAPRSASRPANPRIAAAPNLPRPSSARPQSPAAPDAKPFSGMTPARLSLPAPPSGTATAPVSPGALTNSGIPAPAANSSRNYIRITGSRAAAPVRPDARSSRAEAAAREDARAGRTGAAIDNATAAVDSGRDPGWRLQQRALLFLEQGDNARAAEDFRGAISVYRDQINRGINTDQARSGLDACQNGLRLAQLRLRG